jgi:hypothetical protein
MRGVRMYVPPLILDDGAKRLCCMDAETRAVFRDVYGWVPPPCGGKHE